MITIQIFWMIILIPHTSISKRHVTNIVKKIKRKNPQEERYVTYVCLSVTRARTLSREIFLPRLQNVSRLGRAAKHFHHRVQRQINNRILCLFRRRNGRKAARKGGINDLAASVRATKNKNTNRPEKHFFCLNFVGTSDDLIIVVAYIRE